jgi:hypothetical protein
MRPSGQKIVLQRYLPDADVVPSGNAFGRPLCGVGILRVRVLLAGHFPQFTTC